jgi:hypothetical protein
VAVLVVVPAEEALAERSGVLDAAEPIREGRVVLEGLELALRVGVVVGDVRAGVGAGDAQVGQQHGHRLGGHRGAPVSVDSERAGGHLLAGDGVGQQPLGQAGGLAGGDHPPDHIAAEEVQDRVQVEPGPLGRAGQLGQVPAPLHPGPLEEVVDQAVTPAA